MAADLLTPYEFEFFRNAVWVATLAGALCALIGVYVVLRGMSYIGHGLSHAIFGGFAASALLGVNVILGAGVWGILSALSISGITRRRVIGSDAAIGVITTASFALGLAMFAVWGRRGESFDNVLFGSILGVSVGDVLVVLGALVFAAAVVFLAWRPLLFTTFDPEVAEVSGVRVALVDAALMVVLSLSILVTMRVLGVTLVAATLVIPPTVARMLTSSFTKMLWLSVLIGAASGFVGMNLSYHLDVQSGPTIVLVGTALFLVVFVVTGRRGGGRRAGRCPRFVAALSSPPPPPPTQKAGGPIEVTPDLRIPIEPHVFVRAPHGVRRVGGVALPPPPLPRRRSQPAQRARELGWSRLTWDRGLRLILEPQPKPEG
jgi:ABC-type Mn2+/Zn2+ transport system permease subunit